MGKLGKYSFIAGVLIAIIAGVAQDQLASAALWVSSLLVLFGALVGFLNVTGKEAKDFVLMTTALIVAAYAGNASSLLLNVQFIGWQLNGIFSMLLTFIVPAAMVAAIRSIWSMGKN